LLVILIGVFSGIILLPCSVKAILRLIGFGPIGPIASESLIEASCHVVESLHTSNYVGSFAAKIQAWIGNVVAGSLFAILQSIAMGGARVGSVLWTVGALVGGIIGAYPTHSVILVILLVILIGVFLILLPRSVKAILCLIGFGLIGPIAGESLIEASRHVVESPHTSNM
jgi:hypothetical protein